jgi:translation initiation factor 5B
MMQGYVFRKAKPAIVGVEVLAGRITPKTTLVKENGEEVGEIKQIQDEGKTVSEATATKQVAISMDKPIVGRTIHEEEVFHVQVPESHVKALLTKMRGNLTANELEILDEYVQIMRKKTNAFWAI